MTISWKAADRESEWEINNNNNDKNKNKNKNIPGYNSIQII